LWDEKITSRFSFAGGSSGRRCLLLQESEAGGKQPTNYRISRISAIAGADAHP
jgi:hypothetical protein